MSLNYMALRLWPMTALPSNGAEWVLLIASVTVSDIIDRPSPTTCGTAQSTQGAKR